MANEEKEPKNEQIINTEAAKAKVEEVAGNVKEGANNLFSKIKENKSLSIVCCAVCAVVAVVILALLFGCVFGGPKKVVKTYAKVNYIKPNAKKVCKMMHKNILESVYDDVDECIEKAKKLLKKQKTMKMKLSINLTRLLIVKN